jgi:hypothetical protein
LDVPSAAVKISRQYLDLITGQTLEHKNEFIEQLTHDCIIVQIPRIHGPVQTQIDALLSIFEQKYFIDDRGMLKAYNLPTDNRNVEKMISTLSYVASDDEGRRAIEAEESLRRIIDGVQVEEMVKLRNENKKKDEAIVEKDRVIDEKDRLIAELLSRLNGSNHHHLHNNNSSLK